MTDYNTYTDILYKKSANLPYTSPTYHTTGRTFVPDPLLNRPKAKFTPYKILVASTGIDPVSLDYQSSALPLS